MRKLTFTIILLLGVLALTAQTEDRALKISLQTDLIAYTTPGGWECLVSNTTSSK